MRTREGNETNADEIETALRMREGGRAYKNYNPRRFMRRMPMEAAPAPEMQKKADSFRANGVQMLTQTKFIEDKMYELSEGKGFVPEPAVTWVEFNRPPFVVRHIGLFKHLFIASSFLFAIMLLSTHV